MNIEEISKLDPAFFEEVRAVLPETALEFVRIIGLEAALALISCFGGAEVRFVQAQASWKFERFSEVIGRKAALQLAESFGVGTEVYIPRCTRARRMIRDREIIREFDIMTTRRGISGREAANELAIKFSMSNRQIEKIVNAPV